MCLSKNFIFGFNLITVLKPFLICRQPRYVMSCSCLLLKELSNAAIYTGCNCDSRFRPNMPVLFIQDAIVICVSDPTCLFIQDEIVIRVFKLNIPVLFYTGCNCDSRFKPNMPVGSWQQLVCHCGEIGTSNKHILLGTLVL